MPSLKFNKFTKEIELMGSESFIESNFNKIQDLLVESFGVKAMPMSQEIKRSRKPKARLQIKESQAATEIIKQEVPEAPQVSLVVTKSPDPEISPELKPKRPPLRKYIRKVGMPGQQRIVVEVIEQKQADISIASLKKNFGVSESKIGEIIRDAEKMGKVRRIQNGSYVWTQE